MQRSAIPPLEGKNKRKTHRMVTKTFWVITVGLLLTAIEPSHELGQGNGVRGYRKAKQRQHSGGSRPARASANDAASHAQNLLNSFPVKNDDEYLTQALNDSQASRLADFMQDGFPGQPKVPQKFGQYAGYVKVGAAHALFYYLAEALSEPSHKPLILWFNGGPGCSSFGNGAMAELGPWRVNSDGKTLYFNKYAWNTVANVLFVESPVGVGFSYSNKTSDYSRLGDTPTAKDAYAFLINWFQRFPEYKNREFYITGESYAGHYVPQLAQAILAHQKKGQGEFMNLKGIMVGNGLIDDASDNFGMYSYPWSHGLISDNTYRGLVTNCINITTAKQEALCDKLSDEMNNEMGDIDPYSIYAPVCHQYNGTNRPPPPDTPYLIPGYNPCGEDAIDTYLNRKDVQQALHANTTGLPYSWSGCSSLIRWNWTDSPDSMLPLYRNFIKNKLKILVYSGDVDSIVPLTSTKKSLNLLNLKIKKQWRPWTSDLEVGGYQVDYNGLTFSTVRGAGHEVPLFQPSRAFTLLQNFLKS